MLGHCASKFTCGRNSRQCYTAEQRCDGVNNCNHRTDELHCCQFIALLILRRAQWRKSVFAVTCTHTHTRLSLTALFLGLPGSAGTRKVKPIWILLKQRVSEWQWHQLGHMQVCISLQTNNHASTPPLSFLQAGCPSCHPTNSVKALKALKALQAQTVTCTVCDISIACCGLFKCFDSVHWPSVRASSLWKLSDEVLVWLSVWSEVRIVSYGPADATASRNLIISCLV